jgi:hypothetical protein
MLAVLACIAMAPPALALSEIKQEEVPIPDDAEPGPDDIEREALPPPAGTEPAEPAEPAQHEPAAAPEPEGDAAPPPGEDVVVPFPDPITVPQDPPADAVAPADPDVVEEPDEPVPEILYDVDALPEPVRRMRNLIMEACVSGDVERLRPLLDTGPNGTQLSFGGISGDPIQFLRELSGDGEGQEILAILYEVLEAGYVRLDEGEPGEIYVWPYFFAVPLEALDSRQRVELFKIVTAGDYEDMKNFGAYIFYRTGISPEGRWLFFVAGD